MRRRSACSSRTPRATASHHRGRRHHRRQYPPQERPDHRHGHALPALPKGGTVRAHRGRTASFPLDFRLKKLADPIRNVLEHLRCQARIHADEQRLVHDRVRAGQLAVNAALGNELHEVVVAHLRELGALFQISCVMPMVPIQFPERSVFQGS